MKKTILITILASLFTLSSCNLSPYGVDDFEDKEIKVTSENEVSENESVDEEETENIEDEEKIENIKDEEDIESEDVEESKDEKIKELEEKIKDLEEVIDNVSEFVPPKEMYRFRFNHVVQNRKLNEDSSYYKSDVFEFESLDEFDVYDLLQKELERISPKDIYKKDYLKGFNKGSNANNINTSINVPLPCDWNYIYYSESTILPFMAEILVNDDLDLNYLKTCLQKSYAESYVREITVYWHRFVYDGVCSGDSGDIEITSDYTNNTKKNEHVENKKIGYFCNYDIYGSSSLSSVRFIESPSQLHFHYPSQDYNYLRFYYIKQHNCLAESTFDLRIFNTSR